MSRYMTVQDPTWVRTEIYEDGTELTIHRDEDGMNPREDFDNLAEFYQLEHRSIDLDDPSDLNLRDALDYCGYLDRHRVGERGEGTMKRYLSLFRPDILWAGELHRNGYSQGDEVHVFTVVTRKAMTAAGFEDAELTTELAEKIARAEFAEYAAWALGDVYYFEASNGESCGSMIDDTDRFEDVVQRCREYAGLDYGQVIAIDSAW